MRSKLFFLILILVISVPFSYCETDEGFGEANENLGQVTDTFENENYISILKDVIVNTTLDCVELNYSGSASKIYENFTEYTEIDIVEDRIQFTDYHIDHGGLRTETTYLYYDKGVDYFSDFTHEVNARSDLLQVLSGAGIWAVANGLDAYRALKIANEHFLFIGFTRGTSYSEIMMWECHSGNSYFDSYISPSANTWYYFIIEKNGLAFTCEIYSDSARLNLVDTLSLTLHADNSWRYIYGCDSLGSLSGGLMNNDIEYLWIGDYAGGYDTDGYFITEDYLNYTQGKSLTLLTIADIPDSTGITVQFSSDNVTWFNNHGLAGSSTIRANFSALDLRDLNYADIFMNYSFTGPGEDVTPRLNQSRVITTEGTAGVIIESDAPWIALAIILSLISALLFMRKR